MQTVKIYDDSGGVPRLGVPYEYLQKRLTSALGYLSLTEYTVDPIIVKQPSWEDVHTLLGDHSAILVIIVGRSGKDQYKMIWTKYAPKTSTDKFEQLYGGEQREGGVTIHRLCFVSTRQIDDPFASPRKQELLSNILIHEVGHALAGAGPEVHKTGGVMKPQLDRDDGELLYTSSFKALIIPNTRTPHPPNAPPNRGGRH